MDAVLRYNLHLVIALLWNMLRLIFIGSLFITVVYADVNIPCDEYTEGVPKWDGCNSNTECKFSSNSMQKPNCHISMSMTTNAESHCCRRSHDDIGETSYPSAPVDLHISYGFTDVPDACGNKTALNIIWTAPNDGTAHLLTGFLLQIAHQEIDSVRIANRVFTLNGVDNSTVMQMYYDCYIVNKMAEYHVTVYSLPRSPNDTNSLHKCIGHAEPERNARCWMPLISLTPVPANSSVVVKYKLAPLTFGFTSYIVSVTNLTSRPCTGTDDSTGCAIFDYFNATPHKCLTFVVKILPQPDKPCGNKTCRWTSATRNIYWSNSSGTDVQVGNLCDTKTANSNQLVQSTGDKDPCRVALTIASMSCVRHQQTTTSVSLNGSVSATVDVLSVESPSISSAAIGVSVLFVIVFVAVVVVAVSVVRRSRCSSCSSACRLTAVLNGASTDLHQLLLLLDVNNIVDSSTQQPDDFAGQLALLLASRCQCDVKGFQDDVIRNCLTSNKKMRRSLASFSAVVFVHTVHAARCHYDDRSNRKSGQPVDLCGRLLQQAKRLSSVHVYHVMFRSSSSTISDDDVIRDMKFEADDCVFELWRDTEQLLGSIQQSLLPIISEDEMKFIKLTCDELNDDYDRD